jgi:hypothetical protein
MFIQKCARKLSEITEPGPGCAPRFLIGHSRFLNRYRRPANARTQVKSHAFPLAVCSSPWNELAVLYVVAQAPPNDLVRKESSHPNDEEIASRAGMSHRILGSCRSPIPHFPVVHVKLTGRHSSLTHHYGTKHKLQKIVLPGAA